MVALIVPVPKATTTVLRGEEAVTAPLEVEEVQELQGVEVDQALREVEGVQGRQGVEAAQGRPGAGVAKESKSGQPMCTTATESDPTTSRDGRAVHQSRREKVAAVLEEEKYRKTGNDDVHTSIPFFYEAVIFFY